MLIAKHNRWESSHTIFDGDIPITELKSDKFVIEGSVYVGSSPCTFDSRESNKTFQRGRN
jgi:hypothetical protein